MIAAVVGLLLLTGWCCSVVAVGCVVRAAYVVLVEDAPLGATAALWQVAGASGALTLTAITAAARLAHL